MYRYITTGQLVVVNGCIPSDVARWGAKCTLYPARFLHHSIPAILARRTTTEDIEIPAVRDSLPTQTAKNVSSPIEPTANGPQDNPIITGRSVTDFGRVDYVADPFLMPTENNWHMFFEVYNRSKDPTAVIGHATSRDGRVWRYDEIVLRENIHLSFPYVFRWKGKYYMVPDQQRNADEARVTLYRAESFPSVWEPVTDIVYPGHRTSDNVVFYWDDHWWCLVGHEPSGSLYCYHSKVLEADNWTPHPENPVVSGRPKASRPAGRPLLMSDGILVFYQDCADRYGERVYAKKIDRLTPRTFSEQTFQNSPVLRGTGMVGWNSGRMHHIDLWALDDGFVCAVDGDISLGRNTWAGAQWSIGLYSWERSAIEAIRKH